MKVLDKGFIDLVDLSGDELTIVQAARATYADYDTEMKEALLDRLIKKGHGDPLEHVIFKFLIKCPIFVIRQLERYRHASLSEQSRRYADTEVEFYSPENGEEWEKEVVDEISEMCLTAYNDLLFRGAKKETARLVLPVNVYTQGYWTMNLREMLHILEQRLSEYTQYETRQYAEAMDEILEEELPKVHEFFHEKLNKE